MDDDVDDERSGSGIRRGKGRQKGVYKSSAGMEQKRCYRCPGGAKHVVRGDVRMTGPSVYLAPEAPFFLTSPPKPSRMTTKRQVTLMMSLSSSLVRPAPSAPNPD
jgi:hypothetical protein